MGSSSILDSKYCRYCSSNYNRAELQRCLILYFLCVCVCDVCRLCESNTRHRHVSSDLKDLLLQAVDPQRPLSEIQAHPVISDAVHHIQVGLRAATPHGHRDAEDVDIAAAALRLMKQKHIRERR